MGRWLRGWLAWLRGRSTWLSERRAWLSPALLLLTLLALLVVAGVRQWRWWEVGLLSLTALLCAGAFALALLRPARSREAHWQNEIRLRDEELEEMRQRIFELTQDIRRKADQLTGERDRAEFLHQGFAELASSLEPRRVLGGILFRAIRAARANWGSILLFDEQGQLGDFFCTRDAELRTPRAKEILERGLAGWVVRNRTGDIINDTDQDPRWVTFSDDEEPARSAVAVPFLRRERVLGVIVLSHRFPFQFKETHLALLQQLAQQAAICLENADLYTIAEGERRKLAAILDGTTDAVIVVGREGQVLLLNQAAERAFTTAAEEALDRPLSEAITHEPLNRLFSQAWGREEAVTGELATADERVRYGSVSPVPGVGWVAIFQDITYLKELDRMKSEFVATVSHDLRSPLTAVGGLADLIGMAGDLTEKQQEALGRMRRSVGQMEELIEDLLDLGKIEQGIDMEMSLCQVEEVVQEAVESLSPRAEMKGQNLSVVVTSELPGVLGSATRLRQVVANLLDNAIKYTPAGGQVRVLLYRRDQQVVVEVTDTGVGIAPQDQEQLFQKFYRVQTPETAEIAGTGLGLALARSIVEQHGGRIWVRSAPGRGSTFAFALPVPGDS